ncbi:unnamed protein product [Cyprideis torosa]|uniref:Uncharacterized protein n=1 Tax=Cyprideis torosa TaxID=163714 RepID=A0A7R8ZJX2_9CRUS|nr:unnamed protein product [Cyprideis torosa]CAG0880546.1 unnamed protein product [Cyprideis torosa]
MYRILRAFLVVFTLCLLESCGTDAAIIRKTSLNSKGFLPAFRKRAMSQAGNWIPSAEGALHVSKSPPAEISVVLGEQLIIECAVFGEPAPNTILWLKNGLPLSQSPAESEVSFYRKGLEVGSVSARLVVPCVELSDAARYTCIARGQDGSQVGAKTAVNVEGGAPSKVSRCTSQDGSDSAVIQFWRPFLIEETKYDALFYCRSAGKGNTITWLLPDSSPVVNSDRMKVLSTGDLLLKNPSWEDMGEYTCHVEGPEGFDEVTTFFYPARHTWYFKQIDLWIPGHAGLEGNEAADRMTRQGSEMPYYGPQPAIPISLQHNFHDTNKEKGSPSGVGRSPPKPDGISLSSGRRNTRIGLQNYFDKKQSCRERGFRAIKCAKESVDLEIIDLEIIDLEINSEQPRKM